MSAKCAVCDKKLKPNESDWCKCCLRESDEDEMQSRHTRDAMTSDLPLVFIKTPEEFWREYYKDDPNFPPSEAACDFALAYSKYVAERIQETQLAAIRKAKGEPQ